MTAKQTSGATYPWRTNPSVEAYVTPGHNIRRLTRIRRTLKLCAGISNLEVCVQPTRDILSVVALKPIVSPFPWRCILTNWVTRKPSFVSSQLAFFFVFLMSDWHSFLVRHWWVVMSDQRCVVGNSATNSGPSRIWEIGKLQFGLCSQTGPYRIDFASAANTLPEDHQVDFFFSTPPVLIIYLSVPL